MKTKKTITIIIIFLIVLLTSCTAVSESIIYEPDRGTQNEIFSDYDIDESDPPAMDPKFDTGFNENRSYNTLFTDGIYLYANGRDSIYRITRDEKATSDVLFTPEYGFVFDFVVYEDFIYYIWIQVERGSGDNNPNPALCSYNIKNSEVIIIEENVQINDIYMRGNTIYQAFIEASNEPPPAEAFIISEIIFQINGDGTLTQIDYDPNPPTGRRFVTEYHDESSRNLFSENQDGSDRIKLATIFYGDFWVAYNKIFFRNKNPEMMESGDTMWSVNPDGTGAKALTDSPDINGIIIDFDRDYLFMATQERSNPEDPLSAVWIYYRINYDGTGRVDYPQFSPAYREMLMSFDVMDEWIFVREYQEAPLVRMRVDGSSEPQSEPFVS